MIALISNTMYSCSFFPIAMNAHVFLISILLISFGTHTRTAFVPDVLAHEQYVAVMHSEEYVLPNGTVGQYPSLFIGLFYMAVRLQPDNITYSLQTVVWHQIGYATNITLDGPAPPGQNPVSSLPLIVLALGYAAEPSNCPIVGSYFVDQAFMNSLRSGKLFVQIRTATFTGNVRGQIYSRHDAAIAFLGNSPGSLIPTMGMAVIQGVVIQGRPNFAFMNYWIVSNYVEGVFMAIAGGANYTPLAVFGEIGAGNTYPPGSLVISEPGTGPVVTTKMLFTNSPLVGPGSTGLVLTIQVSQLITVFSQFCRVVRYNDFDIYNSNGTSSAAAAGSILMDRKNQMIMWGTSSILSALLAFMSV